MSFFYVPYIGDALQNKGCPYDDEERFPAEESADAQQTEEAEYPDAAVQCIETFNSIDIEKQETTTYTNGDLEVYVSKNPNQKDKFMFSPDWMTPKCVKVNDFDLNEVFLFNAIT